MEEITLATATVKILRSVLNQMMNGAVDEAGSQLFQLLQKKLQGIIKLDEAKENPEGLKAVILHEVSEDRSFKENLEQLVFRYQKEEQNQVNQYNKYGPNINHAPNSTFIAKQNNIDGRSFRKHNE